MRESVVLPAPEGEEMISPRPRRFSSTRFSIPRSLASLSASLLLPEEAPSLQGGKLSRQEYVETVHTIGADGFVNE